MREWIKGAGGLTPAAGYQPLRERQLTKAGLDHRSEGFLTPAHKELI
jgi:hypothetical protein